MCTNTLYNTIRMTTTQDPTYPLKPNYAQYAKDKVNHAQYHKAQAHSFKVFAFNYICKSRSNYNCYYSSTHHERTPII